MRHLPVPRHTDRNCGGRVYSNAQWYNGTALGRLSAMAGGSPLWLASLALVPALLLLLMLMQWLETHFVRRMVADEIGRLIVDADWGDDIETGISAAAEPLFRLVRR